MERERVAQVLTIVGLAVGVVALLVVVTTALFRSSAVAEDGAADLLEVADVRDAVRGEFERALEAAYAPETVPAEVLAVASERMVQNGYVVDAFADALGDGHRRWLAGEALAVTFPGRVLSEAAVTALRDADLGFAEGHPPPARIPTESIEWPWQVQTSNVVMWQRFALLAGVGGLALAVFGAVRDPRRSRSLRSLAVAGMVTGATLALAAIVLPMPAIRSVGELGVIGALVGAERVLLLAIGLLFVAGGLALHHRATLVVVTIRRSLASKKPSTKESAPIQSGARPLPNRPSRRRVQALDAFFEESGPSNPSEAPVGAGERSGPPDVIVLDSTGEDALAHVDHADATARATPELGDTGDGLDAETDADPDTDADDEPDRSPQPAPAGQLSSEDERAQALAADRLQALARIDGRQSRNRTYLRR